MFNQSKVSCANASVAERHEMRVIGWILSWLVFLLSGVKDLLFGHYVIMLI